MSESRSHFGGIISVLPTAMDCARDAVNRVESIRAYRRPASRGNAESVHCKRLWKRKVLLKPSKTNLLSEAMLLSVCHFRPALNRIAIYTRRQNNVTGRGGTKTSVLRIRECRRKNSGLHREFHEFWGEEQKKKVFICANFHEFWSSSQKMRKFPRNLR